MYLTGALAHETDTYAHVFLCLPSLGDPEHDYEALDDEYVAPLLKGRSEDRAASRKKLKADWELARLLIDPVVNMGALCYAKLSPDERKGLDAMVWQTRSVAVAFCARYNQLRGWSCPQALMDQCTPLEIYLAGAYWPPRSD
jgi:hypothetical protein